MKKTSLTFEELVRIGEETVREERRREKEHEKTQIKVFLTITTTLTIIITGLMVLVNYVNTL